MTNLIAVGFEKMRSDFGALVWDMTQPGNDWQDFFLWKLVLTFSEGTTVETPQVLQSKSTKDVHENISFNLGLFDL